MPTYEWNAAIDQTIVNVIVLEQGDPLPDPIDLNTVIVRKQSNAQGEVSATVTVWNG